MAKVHERVARKDYPAQGIKKGQTYYTWKTRVTVGKTYQSQVHRSATRPTSTTQSAFLSALAELQASFSGVEDADGLRQLASDVRDLGQEEQDKYDNMPEGLQQGETGQMLEERASNCDTWADEIESAADALDEKLEALDRVFAEENRLAWADYHTAINGGPGNSDVEPDEDDPSDLDEEGERTEALNEAVTEAESACPF